MVNVFPYHVSKIYPICIWIFFAISNFAIIEKMASVNGRCSVSGELFSFEVLEALCDLMHFDDAFFCLIKSFRAGCPFLHLDPPLEHKNKKRLFIDSNQDVNRNFTNIFHDFD